MCVGVCVSFLVCVGIRVSFHISTEADSIEMELIFFGYMTIMHACLSVRVCVSMCERVCVHVRLVCVLSVLHQNSARKARV